jgi:hypothetical protein
MDKIWNITQDIAKELLSNPNNWMIDRSQYLRLKGGIWPKSIHIFVGDENKAPSNMCVSCPNNIKFDRINKRYLWAKIQEWKSMVNWYEENK